MSHHHARRKQHEGAEEHRLAAQAVAQVPRHDLEGGVGQAEDGERHAAEEGRAARERHAVEVDEGVEHRHGEGLQAEQEPDARRERPLAAPALRVRGLLPFCRHPVSNLR